MKTKVTLEYNLRDIRNDLEAKLERFSLGTERLESFSSIREAREILAEVNAALIRLENLYSSDEN